MWQIGLIATLIAWVPSAHALSSIHISAERIDVADQAQVHQADLHLSLDGQHRAVFKAANVRYQNLEARNPVIALDLHSQSIALSRITQDKPLQDSFHLVTDIKRQTDQQWIKTELDCAIPQGLLRQGPAQATWQCDKGLVLAERINIPFSLQLQPIEQGVEATLDLQSATFSDEAGLHAAEKLTGRLRVKAQQTPQGVQWQNSLDWKSGELFWQPFYIGGGGHQLVASGVLKEQSMQIDSATLNIHEVGALQFSGNVRLKDYAINALDADLSSLDLATAYPLVFKPLLEKTAFDNAIIKGKAALQVSIRDTELKSFMLKLSDVNIEDNNKKFAFQRINATIPWSYDEAHNVRFSYESGRLLNLPLGRADMQAVVNRYALTASEIQLPILDGAFTLKGVSAARIGTQWYWHLGASLSPISMPDFSHALQLPRMEGRVSAQIPLVTYQNGHLATHGEMVFNVFEGQARVTNLSMQNPLGLAPSLSADIRMRNFDLGSLTRTFSFGAIEGKLDGDVDGLVLKNWKPVQFDAKVQSSPGQYPKKISQRAVENISSLGGAGAAAAIQRSVLRFFEQFNYEKLGLSCTLRNDVCQMQGVESTAQGYVIVKGSGIPAITVLGYNRSVGWGELLSRIQRVIDGNTKAVVN